MKNTYLILTLLLFSFFAGFFTYSLTGKVVDYRNRIQRNTAIETVVAFGAVTGSYVTFVDLGTQFTYDRMEIVSTLDQKVKIKIGTSELDVLVSEVSARDELVHNGEIQIKHLGVAPSAGGSGIAIQRSDVIRNDSTVPGDTVTDALNNLVVGGGPFIWQSYTIAHTDVQDPSGSKLVKLFDLSSGGFIHNAFIKHSQNFTGGSIAGVTISIGTSALPQTIASPLDVFQAVGPKQTTINFEHFSESGATGIYIQALSTGANLSDLTQGSVVIRVLISNP